MALQTLIIKRRHRGANFERIYVKKDGCITARVRTSHRPGEAMQMCVVSVKRFHGDDPEHPDEVQHDGVFHARFGEIPPGASSFTVDTERDRVWGWTIDGEAHILWPDENTGGAKWPET